MARFTQACLTQHLPSSGTHTLLTAYFLRDLPAFFHAGYAHGILPSGLFPLNGAFPASRPKLPSRRWSGLPHGHLSSTSGLCSPLRVRHSQLRTESSAASRCPPGFQLSKAFPRPTLARHRVTSPHVLDQTSQREPSCRSHFRVLRSKSVGLSP